MSFKSDRWIRVAQVICLEAATDDACETPCKDRGGKYQGQVSFILSRI